MTLVQSHARASTGLASGVQAVSQATSAFACTQAAYRFFHNPRITLPDLATPLLAHARTRVPQVCDNYLLVAHDWSQLMYPKHTGKKLRLSLSSKHAPEGYEALTALAISDRDGLPLAPLAVDLRAADGVHSSRSGRLVAPQSPLDELDPLMTYLDNQRLGRPLVHIIDAEADSVAHYREWSAREGRLYLVRGDDRLVEYQGNEQKCTKIQAELHASGQFHKTREVLYQGQSAEQYVAEVPVRLLRPGQRNRPGQQNRQRIPGAPLALRLVLVEVRAANGTVLATWFLLTNVPSGVTAATIALWYYWRWNIEEFFKLLKSAGMQAEQWQQESPAALARRLLVASMACVVVWDLARSEHPQAPAARKLLIQLSGRQMKSGVTFTIPAMLAGLWVLLAMLETLEHHSLDELQALRQLILEKPPP